MLQTPAGFSILHAPLAHPDPYTFVFRGDELLIRADDLALPALELAALLPIESDYLPVGLLGDRYCRAGWLPRAAEAPPGFIFKRLRALFSGFDETLLALAGRAFLLADWARSHRFCGACATPTVAQPGERCLKCPACGTVAYPRIAPAMMVLIRKGDAILLARNVISSTRYSALAGFLEAGESIEEAVHREVYEEVGLRVHDLRYFGSQSWPFPNSLMIAFTAEYETGEITVDPNEIAEARWYGPGDALPEYPPTYSIAGMLIRANLPG